MVYVGVYSINIKKDGPDVPACDGGQQSDNESVYVLAYIVVPLTWVKLELPLQSDHLET